MARDIHSFAGSFTGNMAVVSPPGAAVEAAGFVGTAATLFGKQTRVFADAANAEAWLGR